MFESQVAYYLNKYLGQYIEGIDQSALTISIYSGNVVLKNLQLKQSALTELDLPITVKAGLLGTLTLKVPWNALGRVPVEVTLDRLFILAAPKKPNEDSNGPQDPEDVSKAFHAAKLARIEKQEAVWMEDIERLESQKTQLQKDDTGAVVVDSKAGGGGFLRGIVDTIVGKYLYWILWRTD